MKMNLKIVILGDTYVGKTSLLSEKYYSDYIQPNLGTNFVTKEIMVDDKMLKVEYWDMSGQRSLKSCSVPFYRGADCCVLVYDVTSLESFKSLNYWRNEFLAEISIPKRQWFPFVVIGNKLDLNKRKVDKEWAMSWSRDMEVLSYFETSAANDPLYVKKVFQIIIKNTLDYKQRTITHEKGDRNDRIARLRYCCGFF